MKRAKQETGGAFGNWAVKIGELLEDILTAFSPPTDPGDEVQIKTLLGDEVMGEVAESSPAGVTITETGHHDFETFVGARSIDTMRIYRVTEDDEEPTEPRAPVEPPAPEEGAGE